MCLIPDLACPSIEVDLVGGGEWDTPATHSSLAPLTITIVPTFESCAPNVYYYWRIYRYP